MDSFTSYGWVIILAVLLLVIFLYRKGSFRFGAKALGFGLELEGKAAAESSTKPSKAPDPTPGVHASGSRAVAIGGNVKGATINTGDIKR